jgi:hypothetical protein
MKRKLEEKNESKIKKKVSFGDLELKQYEKRFVWYNIFYAEERVKKFLNFTPKYTLWDEKYGEAYFNKKKEFIKSFDKEKLIANKEMEEKVYTEIQSYLTHYNEGETDEEYSYSVEVNVFSHADNFVYVVDVVGTVEENELFQIIAINNENEFLVIGKVSGSVFVHDNYTSFYILNSKIQLFSEKNSVRDIYKAMNDFERIYELCRENK